jgi:hypothetical protein
VTGSVPLAFVENEYLRKAARVVGVELPSRKVVSTTLLDELFDSTKLFSKSSIAEMDFPCGASDGWQKKYCEQGNPLMNFTVVGNEGGQSPITARSFKIMQGVFVKHACGFCLSPFPLQ